MGPRRVSTPPSSYAVETLAGANARGVMSSQFTKAEEAMTLRAVAFGTLATARPNGQTDRGEPHLNHHDQAAGIRWPDDRFREM